jgi:Mn2+/Fe2+ NRAMP family transporter
MTGLLFFMFACFLVVALKGFQELPAILAGLVPRIPDDVVVAGSGNVRDSFTSLMGIAGGALAAAPILSFSYFTSDDKAKPDDLPRYFWKAVLSLGVIFGIYSTFVLVAGGYALYPLPEHDRIDKVYEAGQVLTHAMPASLAWLGPKLFAAGLFACGLTTLVVVAQLMCYFTLDTLRMDWSYTEGNKAFKGWLIFWIAVPSILAPFWQFPALLKILLLMGINAIIVPLAIAIILYLINKRSLMGDYKANLGRNLFLGLSLLFSISVAGYKTFSANGYWDQFWSAVIMSVD